MSSIAYPFNNSRTDYTGVYQALEIIKTDAVPVGLIYRLAEVPNNQSLYSPDFPNIVMAGFTEVFGASPNAGEFEVDYIHGYIKFNVADVVSQKNNGRRNCRS